MKIELIEIIVTIAIVIWSYFKTTEWYIQKKNDRRNKLINALEVGVTFAYEKVVKPWIDLQKSEKNIPKEEVKLNSEVKVLAEQTAIEEASKIDKKIKDEFTYEELHTIIKKLVKEAKKK